MHMFIRVLEIEIDLIRAGIDSQYEARELSMYYLEMILLRIFDFNGHISSRIADAEYKGGETRVVPWADKHQLGSM